MKKLLLPFLCFLFLSPSLFGQTYCQYDYIDLDNIPGAPWSYLNEDPGGSVSPMWINTDTWVIMDGVDPTVNITNYTNGITPDTNLPNLTFDANGNRTVYVYQNMVEWAINASGDWVATGNKGQKMVSIVIKKNPAVSFTPNVSSVCQNTSSFQLSGGSPSGGSYSGTNVSGGYFNPVTSGSNTIAYSYTAANSCSNSTTATITVNPLPTVNLNNFTPVCANTQPVTLSGGAPSNGTYSGTLGVSNGIFYPSLLNVSTTAASSTITYTYKDSKNCTNSASKTVTVNPLPVITPSAIPSVCANGSVALQNYFAPSGGTFAGPGNAGTGTFSPSVSIVGLNTITYTYTANNCSSSATANVTVLAIPSPTLSSFSTCLNSPATLLDGSPAGTGGTYSGTGISNGQFNPSGLNAGDHTITYTYNDGACSNSKSAIVTILSRNKPVAPSLANYSQVICKGKSQTLQVTNQASNTAKWYKASDALLQNALKTGATFDNITTDTSLIVNLTDGICVSDNFNASVFLDQVKADFTVQGSVKIGDKAIMTNLSSDHNLATLDTFKWYMMVGNQIEEPIGSKLLTDKPSFDFNKPGIKDIKLVAISNYNCKDSITRLAAITVTNGSGVNDFKASGIKIYPNPANEVVNVDLTGQNKDIDIAIINMVGTKLIQKLVKAANDIEPIGISQLPSGIYLLVITIDGKAITTELVKQ